MVSVSMTNVQTPTHISNATSAGISVDHRAKDITLQQSSIKDRDIPKLVNELNKVSREEPLSVSFGYDEELDRVYINVIDKDSGKVIRKLPSEEALKFAKSIKEAVGKLLDKRG